MISHAIAAKFYDCQFQTADSELHESAFAGDAKKLRKLILEDELKDQLNKKNHLGCTPLRLAATGGHEEAARVLLEAGASVDIFDVKGQTPLFVAVKGNHSRCARVLLQHGANCEGSTENVASPMYTAAMNGFIESVRVLLEFGASIANSQGRVVRLFSMDPLQIAVAYQQFECVKLMLRVGDSAMLNQREATLLYHIAVKQKCSVRLFNLLHQFGLSVFRVDNHGKFPWQLDFSRHTEEEKEKVLEFFHDVRDNPNSLKSICRKVLNHSIHRGHKLDNSLDSLCLPRTLLSYLLYDDL